VLLLAIFNLLAKMKIRHFVAFLKAKTDAG
jgi:hypothetical protein